MQVRHIRASQTDGFERTERQCLGTTAGHFFNGQTALKKNFPLERVWFHALRGYQGCTELLIGRTVERTVQIIVAISHIIA
jgi:hypothetical protein